MNQNTSYGRDPNPQQRHQRYERYYGGQNDSDRPERWSEDYRQDNDSPRYGNQRSGNYNQPNYYNQPDYDRGRWEQGSSFGGQDSSRSNYRDRGMGREMNSRDMYGYGMREDRPFENQQSYGRGEQQGRQDENQQRYGRGEQQGRQDENQQRHGRGEQGRSQNERSHRGSGPREYNRSDERIREDVCDRLTDHSAVDASDIEVKVSKGEVTLEGSVDERYMKHLAEDAADDCSGVKDVQNHLKVRKKSASQGNGKESENQEGASSWSTSQKSSK